MTTSEYDGTKMFSIETLLSEQGMLMIFSDFDTFYGNGIVDSALNVSAPFENNIEWHEYQAANSVATNFDQPIC